MAGELDQELHNDLVSIYEEIMWLSNRRNVTPSRARAWYTHVMAESVKRRVRMFTGQVSVSAAADPAHRLRLEHFKRIQTTLTNLVQRHNASKLHSPSEFVETVRECEQVHIVTFEENYAAMRAKGDYAKAGIHLIPWEKVPSAEKKQLLWSKMLRGKVANAAAFQSSAGVGTQQIAAADRHPATRSVGG